MSVFIPSSGVPFRRKKAASRQGQTLVEYALILAIVTVIAIGVFAQLGQNLAIIFSSINSILDTAQASH